MSIFFGYFIWGLILAAPLGWLWWRFRVSYWLSRSRSLFRRHTIQLPPQLEGLVILGKRQGDAGKKS